MKRVLALLGVLLAAVPARAAEKPLAPYEAIRLLQAAGDRVAVGDKAALKAQAKLVDQATEAFLSADPGAWKDARNLRSLVIYLFNGGHPQTVRALLGRKIIDVDQDEAKDFDKLIQGGLAYAEGRDGEAKANLDGFDPRRFTANLGGHLALIQAMLAPADDRTRALHALDLARLLVPGTLVEEAALRRELFITSETDDLDRFLSLSRQYFYRFDHSLYAQNFHLRFLASLMTFALKGTPEEVAEIFRMVAGLDANVARRVYLTIAQTAVAHGRTELAALAARKAAALAPKDSPDHQRANLYLSATEILSDTYDKGLATAEAIDASQLSKRDAALKAAVVSVAKTIRRPAVLAKREVSSPAPKETGGEARAMLPRAATPPGPAGRQDRGSEVATVEAPASSATIDLAEKALAEADKSLKGEDP